MNKNYAFTIIELIVVVAILGILGAILLPSLYGGKKMARKTICLNNLRQISLANTMYTDSYGRYPPALLMEVLPVEIQGATTMWNAKLLPYLMNNRKIFYCPAYHKRFKWNEVASPAGYNFPTNIQGGKPFSYAMNSLGVREVGMSGLHKDNTMLGRAPSEIVNPSDMICIGDGPDLTNNGKGGRPANAYGIFYPAREIGGKSRIVPWIEDIHSEGCNMVFLDGHVEWGDVKQWKSEQNIRRWNFDNLGK